MHQSVLLQEIVDGLGAKKDEVILDGTVGGGGHSEALCRSIGTGKFVCLDADEDAIERSRQRLEACGCEFLFSRTNYRHLDTALERFGIAGVNRVLLDLGLSSFQLNPTAEGGSGRGFSFMRDEPLQMTFSKHPAEGELTATQIVNEWSEDTLATILESYGEEKQARRIARQIVEAREKTPIKTTLELVAIIESVVKPARLNSRSGGRKGKIHPATKTFQALRMAVNDEFQALKDGLTKAWEKLLPQGRIAVISFHSIEDRTVKDFFRKLGKSGAGMVLTKKPITPSPEEIKRNPRARSAKLRIIEKA